MFSNFFKQEKKFSRGKTIADKAKRRVKHAQDKKQRTEKIPVDRLRVGMFVRELDIPWEESTFMFQGLEIKSQQDILQVQKQCTHVWVDYTEYKLAGNLDKSRNSTAFDAKTSLIQLEEEYKDAREVYEQSREIVSRVFEQIAVGGDIDVDSVKQSVSGSVDSILRNPDTSIWLTRLSEKDNYTAQHSLNVAALSIIVGRSLGLIKTELEKLGVAALLHDVGKAMLPTQLIAKHGQQLSSEEKVALRKHVVLGFGLISDTENIDPQIARVVLHHHENVDGSGYPKQLKGDDIPLYSRIIAIADAYDRMVTNLPGKETLSQSEAMGVLYKERGRSFDEELVIKFIDGIGIFPPGSLVEMTNGEVGIVLTSTREKLKPKVIMILDKVKDAAIQQVIDLSGLSLDTDGSPYQIRTTLKDGSFGIFVNDFQRAGLRLG